MRSFVLVLGAGLLIAAPGYAQDAASGEKIFLQCKACHQIGENARNAVGPVLNGLFGRKSGTIQGLAISGGDGSISLSGHHFLSIRSYI